MTQDLSSVSLLFELNFLRRVLASKLKEGVRLKALIKNLLARTPYRLVKDRGANRFQAIPQALRNLAKLGYDPRLIIDAGAHTGTFALEAHQVFPHAKIHMIEPQPTCQSALRSCASANRFSLHPLALAASANQTLQMVASPLPDTGAYIAQDGEAGTVSVRTTTIDTLFPKFAPSDRALLKMDLQGYEIEALRGSERALAAIEVILSEVSFFAHGKSGATELIQFLHDRDFVLFDVGSLSGRTRDNRLIEGDLIFARRGTSLLSDNSYV